jgi:hypothetical protein
LIRIARAEGRAGGGNASDVRNAMMEIVSNKLATPDVSAIAARR